MPSETIIDCEVHLLHPEAWEQDFARGSDEPTRRAVHEHPEFGLVRPLLPPEALLDSMDRSGIDAAVVMGMPWRDPGRLRDNNDHVARCVRRWPKRLRGLYIPDPSSPRRAAREVEQLDDALFAGVKLVPGWQRTAADDPALAPLWRAVEARGFFAMLHTDHPTQSLDGDTPYRLLRCLRANPGLKVLAPHLGGLLCLYGLLPSIRPALANVHFVTSVSATMDMVEFAARVNPANLVFGTDFPFNHCHSQGEPLDRLRRLGLPAATTGALLGGTARGLLGFPGREGAP